MLKRQTEAELQACIGGALGLDRYWDSTLGVQKVDHLVESGEQGTDYSDTYARQFRSNWNRIETEEQELLAQRLAGWQEKYPDVTVNRVVARDRPVRHLLDDAAEAQLLVVGNRGRGRISGMLLSSTSQALIYHAPCPLLVVRPLTTP